MNFSVVFISETWLTNDLDDRIFGLSEYTIIRCDRGSRAGGVAILVRNHLKSKPVFFDVGAIEVCGVDIMGVEGEFCRLICVYREPSYNQKPLQLTQGLIDCLTRLVSNCRSFIICGDFNIPSSSWNPPSFSNSYGEALHSFIVDNGLVQHVTEPTHVAGNILDLVISSDEILINHLTVEAPILADHMSILFVLNFRVQKKCNFVDRKQFSRCNDLIAFLSHINWYLIYEISTDVTAFWQELQLVMKYGIDTFIPVKRVSKVKKSSFPT